MQAPSLLISQGGFMLIGINVMWAQEHLLRGTLRPTLLSDAVPESLSRSLSARALSTLRTCGAERGRRHVSTIRLTIPQYPTINRC